MIPKFEVAGNAGNDDPEVEGIWRLALVPRGPRERDPGPVGLLGQYVAEANAVGLHSDPHGPRTRLGDRAFLEFKGPTGMVLMVGIVVSECKKDQSPAGLL